MNILSLYDGMACGHIAFMLEQIPIDRYVAYEIDGYAVKTAVHNFPGIEQRGDVFDGDFTEFEGFDWLVGGSPCTYWSIAQKNNRETEASGLGWELFCQYVRALKEAKPKYFLYENNKSMSKAIRESITETFGFEPVCINSALVSAQNRQRLYWVGRRNDDGTYSKVDVPMPEDRGILLRDVLEYGFAWKYKQGTIDANYYKGGNYSSPNKQSGQRMCVAESVCPMGRDKSRTLTSGYVACSQRDRCMDIATNGFMGKQSVAEPVGITADGKAQCVRASCYKDGIRNLVGNDIDRRTGVAEPIYIGAVPENNGTYLNGKQPSQQYRVYDRDGKGVAVTTAAITNVAEPVCVAQRGRYSDSGNRTVKGNGPIEQYYEARDDGKTNVLTTVQKDNAVCEPVRVGCMPSPDGELKNSQAFRVYSTDGKSVNLTSGGGGAGGKTGLYAIQVDEAMRVREATKQGYTDINIGDCVDMTQPNSKTRRGRNMRDKSNCCMTSCQYYQYVGKLGYATPCEWDEDGRPIKAVSCADGKVYTVYEVKDGKITIKGKEYPIKLVDGYYIIRKLTVRECMRLQTVPEWYEFPVSDTQAYKMLGNGWTVEVIRHLIRCAVKDGEKND